LINYINNQLGNDYTWLFNQYLKVYMPPQLNCSLEEKGSDLIVTYSWTNVVTDFKLPVEMGTVNNRIKVYATVEPQEITFPGIGMNDFYVDQEHAYFMAAFVYK
jgi:hypothetical protein